MQHPIRQNRPHAEQAFTIIEVLVATALFAIVVLVVLVPITGLFGLTKRSTTQVGATNQAQQWVEQIKGQWQNQTTYDQACVTSATSLPTTVSVSIQDEDLQGNTVGSPYNIIVKTNCASQALGPNPAPLRLIKVTATINGVLSTLSTEVAR